MSKRKPKILLWDLETSHNLVASFTLRPEYIHYSNILKERSIICGAWKWLGDKKIDSISVIDNLATFKKNRHDDYYIVAKLKTILEEADVIIAHNGDKFDLKYFNTRCLYHGLSPIAKPITIDTYKVVKRHFNLNSNRLDYLGRYLGLGEKIKTSNDMWLAVVDENVSVKDAIKLIKLMVTYNKQDVNLLEKIYLKLRPYMDNHPNANLFIESKVPVCPSCSSVHLQSRGYRRTRTSMFRKFHCQDCGAWSSGESVKTSKVK